MKFVKYYILLIIMLSSIIVSDYIHTGYMMYKAVDDVLFYERIKDVQLQEDYIELGDISTSFLQAIIAIEDHRYYEHSGYDLIAIGRASIQNLSNGEIVSGASTITQQLSKNLFLSFDQTYERKIAEILLASKLENNYTKDEILTLYVNVVNFGENQLGIGSASTYYFNKQPSELSAAEAILLAGVPQSPYYYSLVDHFDEAVVRSDRVIQAMMNQSILTPFEGDQLKFIIRSYQ